MTFEKPDLRENLGFNVLKHLEPAMVERKIERIQPIPKSALVSHAEDNLASEFHKRLVKWIRDFDASLDENHETGVRLVSFGQSVTFHLLDIGFWNPSLVIFKGKTGDGEPVELIQHVSQISVLLMRLPLLEPDKPKRPFGFHPVAELPKE